MNARTTSSRPALGRRFTFALAATVGVASLGLTACGDDDPRGTGDLTTDADGTFDADAPIRTGGDDPQGTDDGDESTGGDAGSGDDDPDAATPPGQSDAGGPPACADVEPYRATVEGTLGPTGNSDEQVMAVIRGYGREIRDVFGGLWIDRFMGGALVVAVTDDPAPHREALLTRTPRTGSPLGERDDVTIDVVQVQWTEKELLAFQREVNDLFDQLTPALDSTSVDTIRNRVGVSLIDPTPEQLALVVDTVPADALCVDVMVTPPRPDGPLDIIAAPGSDPLVTCDQIGPMPLSVWEDPPLASEVDHPAAAALEAWLTSAGDDLPPEIGGLPGWPWLAPAVAEDRAIFVQRGDAVLTTLTFTLEDGVWLWAGSSMAQRDCDLRVALPEGLGQVDLSIDRRNPPSPDDTVLRLRVSERACASGRPPGDRLLDPQVIETDDQILLGFVVVEQVGGQECPGNPRVRVTVELASPLGDRTIVDGTTVPPRPLRR
jgi:hypothetical protein